MRSIVLAALLSLSALSAFAQKPVTQNHECTYRDTGGCGQTITDTVDIYGCRDDDFYYYNIHRVFLNQGQTYQFTITAVGQYAPFVGVSRQDLDYFLAEADGPVGGSAVVTWTADVSGYHEIFAGPAERLETGSYRFTMTCGLATACTPSATEACLLDGRFKVAVAFVNQFATPPVPGNFAGAKLLPGNQNPDVATFGLSSAQAIEVVVRVQDARPFAPRFDIYYGGLTDLEYTVRVTDTKSGVTKTYRNPPGTVGGGVDRVTFPAN